MKDTIRDSTFGQLARIVTRDRYFNYVEENPQFQFPCESFTSSSSEDGTPAEAVGDASASIIVNSTAPKEERNGSVVADLEKAETTNGTDLNYHDRILSRDMQLALQRSTSQAIKPEKTADGKILVDWYTTGKQFNTHLRGKC
jgi:MFS transporter, DHA1 family, multidrug resistance protein